MTSPISVPSTTLFVILSGAKDLNGITVRFSLPSTTLFVILSGAKDLNGITALCIEVLPEGKDDIE